MDLYEDLGVRRDASIDEIKSAHRKAARKNHPDVGGDRGAFERVQMAYLVLSDQQRRDTYDRTGEIDLKVNNRLSVITEQIMAAFDAAVKQTGTAMRYKDLIAVTRKLMEHKRAEMKNGIANIRAERDGAKIMLERLKFTGEGFDPIGSVVRQRLSQLEAAIPRLEAEIADYSEAVAYLDNYGFEFEQQAPAQGGSATTAYIQFV
jgi:curved DNA-binding protein CbpA